MSLPRHPKGAVLLRRGFTLVELMVVVTIVGLLGVIGIASLRGYVFSAKTSEATAVIQAIRVGQERFRAENQRYLDVTGLKGGSMPTDYYPTESPGPAKHLFSKGSSGDSKVDSRWRLLAPPLAPNQLVQFGYVVVAGPPGVAMPAPHTVSKPSWPAPEAIADPWYVIEAKGNADGDNIETLIVASSLNGEIYIENEGD